MATNELSVLMSKKAPNGDLDIIYPVTKKDNIVDLEVATDSSDGIMSATDKAKLDTVAEGATAVKEETIKSWGFTKNTGTYSKPSSGIPKTDLEESVRNSLSKADSALQSHQDISGKADLNHTHTKLEITDFSHTHDDRYYTESEIDTKLNTKLNVSLKGTASGLAELDSSGKVPSSQLPSYVDDVLEYDNLSSFPSTGETGKIYVAKDNNKTYRWSGSGYTEISPSLALGETSSTAYRGDRGKIAYDHSQIVHAPSTAQANVIETIKVNGTALTPNSKAVNITVPTDNNQLANGAGYITSSGTAKTISDILPISKGGTGKTTGVDAANTLINSLSTGSATPNDADYYVSQYAGGGTTTTTYHRRPMSALWDYIKSKLATVATSGSYNDLSNKPTIPSVGNGTITIKQAGTSKGTFTMNQSGNTTIELSDNNTTYTLATASSNGLMSATDKSKLDSGYVVKKDSTGIYIEI